MTGYPNDQSNPAAAIPVWLAPPQAQGTDNLTTNGTFQVKNAPGVFQGISVNTAGTTSTAKVYDGESATVTVDIATPGLIHWTAHPFAAGDAVFFETTGALPTGLTAGTLVYVSTVGLTADEFQVADTKAHALAGTNSINTSGTQSGVQTGFQVSRPLGTFSTTTQGPINLPGAGARLAFGLIVQTAGGAAADITVYYV